MIAAYKEHSQFILILAIMYIAGVWGGPIIYAIYPVVMILFGLKGRYFELFISAIWLLMLGDYVPVKNATYDDLQFAKDLKSLIPVFLFLFYLRDRDSFPKIPSLFWYFTPFFLIAIISLNYSINFSVGIQKTISFILMYFCIPIYVVKLHNDYNEKFWKALITFVIGMLSIGIFLGLFVPSIGLLSDARFKGVLGNPNGLGIFLNMTFIIWILVKELDLAKFTRNETIYVLLIIFWSLLWGGSRNGMMSVFLFYLMYRFIKVNWFIAIIVLIAFLSFDNLIFEFFLGVIDFFNLESYFRVDSLEEGSGRKIAWVFAWGEIVRDNFLIGGGFGHDENIMRPNYEWLSRLGHNGGVHNSYLSFWFDTGLIGVLAYYLGFLIIIMRSMRFNYIALAVAVSILFNSTYESWLVASLNPFTIMLLVILTILISNFSNLPILKEKTQPKSIE